MRHRFFAAAYRGSAVPQISIWLGLSLGLLPSGVAAASEAPTPTAAPVLSTVSASTAPDTNLDANLNLSPDASPDAGIALDAEPAPEPAPASSASGVSAEPAITPDVILESFTATVPAGAEAASSSHPASAQPPDASTGDRATGDRACVVGCDRAAPFVFRAPVEAIAPFPAAQPAESATVPETEDAAPIAASTATAPTVPIAPTASAPTASAPTASAPTASAPTVPIAPTASAPTASAPTASAPIAPALSIATTRSDRRTIRAAARTATRVSAPAASTTAIAPTVLAAPTTASAPIAPAAQTAQTRAAARATTANRAATRATVRATTAERDPFGIQMISSPPLAVPVAISDSDYQTPFPPASSSDAATLSDASTPSNTTPIAPASSSETAPTAATLSTRRRPLTPPSLQIHGVYIYQGGESSARVRFTGLYPITPNVQAGGSIDVTTGNGGLFNEENSSGVSVNELYVTASLPSMPNLRFVIGQIDLTSYFDRNSFAKDGETQFFNPIFQTNPALTAVGIGSRAGALVNWSATDDLEIKAAAFSSARSISEFALDGFAGEIGLRLADNFVVRGTYATGRDNGANTGFREIYSIQNGRGLRENDREEAYGVNAELFIPQLSMGLFGRYGHYRNLDIDLGGNTYVFGVSFLDLFTPNDRLGIGYGRGLSNDRLRQDLGNRLSDVGEIFYDFEVVPHLRLGFTLQALNNFSETIAGVRIRTVFNLTPRRSH